MGVGNKNRARASGKALQWKHGFVDGHVLMRDLGQTLRGMAASARPEDEEQPKRSRRRRGSKRKGKVAEERPRTFVLCFNGDPKASQVHKLRHEITALLSWLRPDDHVVVLLESPGGYAHTYGLAAAQLQRLRGKAHLTVAVDTVAASGGYQMACVAETIVAAPHAIVGSIGVVVEFPNFNKALKRIGVEVELHTAGEHKRTLTMLGENDDAGRAQLKRELAVSHELFKNWVGEHRPAVDIAKVSTGQHWSAMQSVAEKLNLVDRIATSDELLTERAQSGPLYEVQFRPNDHRGRFAKRLGSRIEASAERIAERLLERLLERLTGGPRG
jgi:serine protease SohB